MPPLSTSMAADDLRPCVSAENEELCALHDAGVDEDFLACWNFATTKASIDKPLVHDSFHGFGPVRDGLPSGWHRVLCPPPPALH